MRKKNDALKEQILNCARQIADENGPKGINMRSIADKSGIAVGTVYNYYANKDEILLTLTEEYWYTVFAEIKRVLSTSTFDQQLREVHQYLQEHLAQSGEVWMASLEQVQHIGRNRMQKMLLILRESIAEMIRGDMTIHQETWSDEFSIEQYADFILANLIAILRKEGSGIDHLIEIIRRTIY